MCVRNTNELQYIPRNMHTVFALLCFVVVIHWLIFPYPSGLLHWHCGNLTIAPVPAKQPWWVWINTSCEFIMNDCITTTKQSTTKPCAYFLGYTVVSPAPEQPAYWAHSVWSRILLFVYTCPSFPLNGDMQLNVKVCHPRRRQLRQSSSSSSSSSLSSSLSCVRRLKQNMPVTNQHIYSNLLSKSCGNMYTYIHQMSADTSHHSLCRHRSIMLENYNKNKLHNFRIWTFGY